MTAAAAATRAAAVRRRRAQSRVMAYCCRESVVARRLRFPLLDLDLEVLVGHVGDVDPRVRHLVHGAVAVADPLRRIRVRLVGRRVVVPRGDADDGALRQQRRRFIRVVVAVVPVEVEVVDVAQELLLAARQDRFHHHRLAAQVHVRLEALDAARLLHHEEPLRALDGVRRDVDAAGAHQVQAPGGTSAPAPSDRGRCRARRCW